MCGRFALTSPPEAVRAFFALDDLPNFPARYNIAPTQPIAMIHAERRSHRLARRLALARWAFLPGFVKDPKAYPLVFNARAEGLADKASFRNALRRRRCLVPADAFYEWQRPDTGRVGRPFMMRRADGRPLALAALWETWSGPNGEEVDTACIVTTDANGTTAAIHPRLPAIVEASQQATWLDPDADPDVVSALLRPTHDDTLTVTAIGEAVNKVANEGPAVQRAAAASPSAGPAQGSLF